MSSPLFFIQWYGRKTLGLILKDDGAVSVWLWSSHLKMRVKREQM
jgi:hypothetical protein